MTSIDDVLLYFSIKYNGDWTAIYKAIRNLEEFSEEKLAEYKKELTCNYVTMLSNDYPMKLKEINQPPYVLFYLGDFSTINNSLVNICINEMNDGIEKITEGIIKNVDRTFIISDECDSEDFICSYVSHNSIENKIVKVLSYGFNELTKDNRNDKVLYISEYPPKIKGSDEERNVSRIVNGLASSHIYIEV